MMKVKRVTTSVIGAIVTQGLAVYSVFLPFTPYIPEHPTWEGRVHELHDIVEVV
jgi:hypothetical protein